MEKMIKNKRENFRKNLPFYMKEADYTREKLASALKTDASTISKWLSGKTKPTFDFICEILELLGCTFEELIGD